VGPCGDRAEFEQGAEVGGERVDGLVSLVGVVAHRGADDEREIVGEGQRLAGDVFLVNEGGEDRADGEDVGAGVDGRGVAPRLFGAHEAGRAEGVAVEGGLVVGVEESSEPEVDHPDVIVAGLVGCDEDVGGGEVAVENAVAMGARGGGAELQHEAKAIVDGEVAETTVFGDGRTVDELHGDVGATDARGFGDGARVEDGDDVGMAKGAKGEGFGGEAARGLARAQGGGEGLEGHLAAERTLAGAVDHTGAALAEHAEEVVLAECGGGEGAGGGESERGGRVVEHEVGTLIGGEERFEQRGEGRIVGMQVGDQGGAIARGQRLGLREERLGESPGVESGVGGIGVDGGLSSPCAGGGWAPWRFHAGPSRFPLEGWYESQHDRQARAKRQSCSTVEGLVSMATAASAMVSPR
jgi:hypothetical protein